MTEPRRLSPVPTHAGVEQRGSEQVHGLQRQLVESLGLDIATRSGLNSGDQILPEELAQRFGVSRTVVREALKVLETKGMVSARPRTGTRVRHMHEWRLLDPDVIRWRSEGPDAARQFHELLSIRGAIEPLAAKDACVHATEEQLVAMRRILDRMKAAVESQDWTAFTEADVEFHRDLLACSGNEIMTQFAEPIEAALRVRHRLDLIPHRLTAEIVTTHREVIDAVGNHEPAVADLATRSIVDEADAAIMLSLTRADGTNSQ